MRDDPKNSEKRNDEGNWRWLDALSEEGIVFTDVTTEQCVYAVYVVIVEQVSRLLGLQLAPDELVGWANRLGPPVWAAYGEAELANWEDPVEGIRKVRGVVAERFVAELTQSFRSYLAEIPSNHWRLQSLAARAEELVGVRQGPRFIEPLKARVELGPFVLEPEPAARPAQRAKKETSKDVRRVARAWRELQLREFETTAEFQSWLEREKILFRWMYRHAVLSKDGSTLYLKRSIQSFAEKLERSERTVMRALKGLMRRGVIGWIVKGSQRTGSSCYWLPRSVKALLWSRLPVRQRKGWQSRPPKRS